MQRMKQDEQCTYSDVLFFWFDRWDRKQLSVKWCIIIISRTTGEIEKHCPYNDVLYFSYDRWDRKPLSLYSYNDVLNFSYDKCDRKPVLIMMYYVSRTTGEIENHSPYNDVLYF